jgi:hypothetical protein
MYTGKSSVGSIGSARSLRKSSASPIAASTWKRLKARRNRDAPAAHLGGSTRHGRAGRQSKNNVARVNRVGRPPSCELSSTKVARAAGDQSTQLVERIAAIFVAEFLQTFVELLLVDPADALALAEVLAKFVLKRGPAHVEVRKVLSGAYPVARRCACAASAGNSCHRVGGCHARSGQGIVGARRRTFDCAGRTLLFLLAADRD